MYDLHTHSYHSDGVLGLAELARRCEMEGYCGLVISDHCDHANIEQTVRRAVEFCRSVAAHYAPMKILPGCEITHVKPRLIGELVKRARELGARVVVVHGETIVEPVEEGTNRAAIEAGADVVGHPGLIKPADVALAAKKGVRLEISGRQGHCFSNGHVARLALENGALLSFGSDGHEPGDYPNRETALRILQSAGLSLKQAARVLADNAKLFR
jgi:putative hydrolase